VRDLESSEADIRKEATWAIANATSGGSDSQIQYLVVEAGCVGPLSNSADSGDVRIVSTALEGLENILRSGDREKGNDSNGGINPYLPVFDDILFEKIIPLLEHERAELADRAAHIIAYFGTDEHA